jgi:hypothetical protein
MPNIGERIKGSEIGFYHPHRDDWYIWDSCLDCGKERWVRLVGGKPRSTRCLPCSTKHKNISNRLVPMGDKDGPPVIGEIRHGCDIDKSSSWKHKFIWAACVDCGKQTWVFFVKGKDYNSNYRCSKCSGSRQVKKINILGNTLQRDANPHWKGGRCKLPNGYIQIRLYPEDPYYPMADSKHYVLEHRLVMAKQLGRCLYSWEIVHHKHTKYPQGSKEDKGDNRSDNLKLVSDDVHKQITILETKLNKRIQALESRVTLLESENVLLRTQLDGNPDDINLTG